MAWRNNKTDVSKKKKITWRPQSLTSVISTTMVLVLLGLVVLFALTARVLADSVRENLTVTVVMEDDTPAAEAKKTAQELEQRPYVSELLYISAEEALAEQTKSMGIDPMELMESNPFPITMELKMRPSYACNDSLQWISRQLRDMKTVADVMYQKDLVENLNSNLRHVSLVLLVIAGLLVLVSVSLIHNTVLLSVHSHRFTIHTMKLVGARWSFIRRPFMLRSLGTGVLSALLADVVLLGGIWWAARYDAAILQYVTGTNVLLMLACVLLCGLLLTSVCTYLSVTRYLRMREERMY